MCSKFRRVKRKTGRLFPVNMAERSSSSANFASLDESC